MSTDFSDLHTYDAFRDLLRDTTPIPSCCSGVSYRSQKRSFQLKDLVTHVVKKAIGPEGQLIDHNYVSKEITGRLRDLKQNGDNILANRSPFWKFLILIGQWIAQCLSRCFGKNEKGINIEAEITKLELLYVDPASERSNPTIVTAVVDPPAMTPTPAPAPIVSILVEPAAMTPTPAPTPAPISTIVELPHATIPTPAPIPASVNTDLSPSAPVLSPTVEKPTIKQRLALLHFSHMPSVSEFYNTYATTPEIRSQFFDECVAVCQKKEWENYVVNNVISMFLKHNEQYPLEFENVLSKHVEFFISLSQKNEYVRHIFSSLNDQCTAILCRWVTRRLSVAESVHIFKMCKQLPMKKEIISKVLKEDDDSRYLDIDEKISPIVHLFECHYGIAASDSTRYLLSLLDTDEKFNKFLIKLRIGVDTSKMLAVLVNLTFPKDKHQIDLVLNYLQTGPDDLFAYQGVPAFDLAREYRAVCLWAYLASLIIERDLSNQRKFVSLDKMIEKYGVYGQEAVGQLATLSAENFDLILDLIFTKPESPKLILLKKFTSNLIQEGNKTKIIAFYDKLVLRLSGQMRIKPHMEHCSFEEITDLSIIASIIDRLYDIHFNLGIIAVFNQELLFEASVSALSALCLRVKTLDKSPFLPKQPQAVLNMIKQRPYIIDNIHPQVYQELGEAKLPELVNPNAQLSVKEIVKIQVKESIHQFFREIHQWPPGIGNIVADYICEKYAPAPIEAAEPADAE